MKTSSKTFATILSFFVLSCGSDTSDTGAPTKTGCVPGQQIHCGCPGGETGSQVCLPDGSGYDTCECGGAAGSGGGAGAGGSAGDAGTGGLGGSAGDAGTGGLGGSAGVAGQGGGAGQGGSAGAAGQLGDIVDLVVDADRDGTPQPTETTDQQFEDAWTADHGAVFLVNADDDDEDSLPDADDAEVNVVTGNEEDAKDLARILVRAWPDAPADTTATLTLDADSVSHVRIHRLQNGTWTGVAGKVGPCGAWADPTCQEVASLDLTATDLQEGVELGIEAMRWPGTPDAGTWDGMVSIALGATDGDGQPIVTDDNPVDGKDEVVLRVAPWLKRGALQSADRVYASEISSPFITDLTAVLSNVGVDLQSIPETGIGSSKDRWVRNSFQTGFSTMPAPGGVHGMRVAMPRPWGNQGAPSEWLNENYLGPDQAVLVAYETLGTGTTFDSYGNHMLIPPYQRGVSNFASGRILVGNVAGLLPELPGFYLAQHVQAPVVTVQTDWLTAGFVSQVFRFVPADTPRGWQLLVADPMAFVNMLQDWQVQGHGAAEWFVGKTWDNGTSATVSIDDLLYDPDMMAWNQEASASIDSMLDAFKSATGLMDAEIVHLPVCFHEEYGAFTALAPNPIDGLLLGDDYVLGYPFGPSINGQDAYRVHIEGLLEAAPLGSGAGLTTHYVNDWTGYHTLIGGVFSGTNIDGPLPEDPWWTVPIP